MLPSRRRQRNDHVLLATRWWCVIERLILRVGHDEQELRRRQRAARRLLEASVDREAQLLHLVAHHAAVVIGPVLLDERTRVADAKA